MNTRASGLCLALLGALLAMPGTALAQCSVSIVDTSGSTTMLDGFGNPFTYTGPGEIITVAGGDIANAFFLQYLPQQGPFPQGVQQSGGPGSFTYFLPTGCHIPGATQPFELTGYCLSTNPETGTCCLPSGDVVDGTFPYPTADPTIHVQVLDPPGAGGANVQIDWEFPSSAGGSVRVESDQGFISSAVSGTSLETFPPGEHHVTGWCCHHISGDSVTFTVPASSPAPKISALVTFNTPGTTATSLPPHGMAGTSTKVQVPLGAVFSLGLVKTPGPLQPPVPIQAIYSMGVTDVHASVFPIATATVMPSVIRTLFPSNTLVQVDTDAAAATKRFIAVHLGTAAIEALPTGSSDPVQTFNVEVVKPTQLGSTQPGFDDYLINVAHNSGIPPQYLKGQARQEMRGHLSATNYRYEPCGADLQYVSAGRRLAYTNNSFIRFRLDDARNVTLHPGVPDELDPRSVFFIVRPDPTTQVPTDRRITDDDTGVTAQNIWDDNNDLPDPGEPRAPDHNIRWNFDTGCTQSNQDAINAPNSTTLSFTAQTPTAASLGIFQIMWDEARQDVNWGGVTANGVAGVKHPKYVFDRPDYVNIGGGSAPIGANLDVSHWRSTATKFSSLDAFESIMNPTLRRYNWAWTNDQGERYGTVVIRYSRSFLPTLPAVVFP